MFDSFFIKKENINWFFNKIYKTNLLYYEPFLLAWTYHIYIDNDFKILEDSKDFYKKYLNDDYIINTISGKSSKSIPKNTEERKKYIFRTKTTLIRYYESILAMDISNANANMEDDYYDDNYDDDDDEYDENIINIDKKDDDDEFYNEKYDGEFDIEDIGDNPNDMITGTNKNDKGKEKA